jgi:hypothetical protein
VRQDLPFGQGLGEDVGCHVVGGTISEGEGVVSNDLVDEVETDVDVFGPCMVVVLDGKLNLLNRSLVVAVESGWGGGNGE